MAPRFFILQAAEVIKPLHNVFFEIFRECTTFFALCDVGCNHEMPVPTVIPPETCWWPFLYVGLALPLLIANPSFYHFL
jgi:hypothetical protein